MPPTAHAGAQRLQPFVAIGDSEMLQQEAPVQRMDATEDEELIESGRRRGGSEG